ncbi:glycosyltransferase [Wenxinia marina]|nr:glycosyltransferase [Wenxinia marina]GGL78821.1 hypothetical protein GCM10011392_36610 [Wenxinia marina]
MTQLPQSFLTRIAAYPAPVQDALSREIDPGVIARHLAVLHGETDLPEARIAALMEKPVLADSFIARLLASARFAERVGHLFDALRSGTTAVARAETEPEAGTGSEIAPDLASGALIAREARTLIAPLSDPAAPYLSKLGEMAAASAAPGPGRLTPWQARALIALARLHAALSPAADPALSLAQALLEAARTAEPGAALVADAMAVELGAPMRLGRGGAEAVEAPDILHRYAAIRRAESGLPQLGGFDLRSLAATLAPQDGALGADGSASALALAPPVPVRVRLDAPPPPSLAARWAAFREAGLVASVRHGDEAGTDKDDGDGGGETGALLLHLPGDAVPSPLTLAAAALSWRDGEAAPLEAADAPSWKQQAPFLPEPRPRRPVGRVVPPGAPRDAGTPGAPRRIELRRAGEAFWQAARETAPETAAAFVLRLDDGAPAAGWTGLDSCHLVEGTGRAALAALAARVRAGAFDAAVLKTPLLLVGRDTPTHPDWIGDALARHWRYGGALPTSPVGLRFDAVTGGFKILPPAPPAGPAPAAPPPPVRPVLTRMMVAAAASLPLGALAETPVETSAETPRGTPPGPEAGSNGSAAAPQVAGRDGLPRWLDWVERGLLLFTADPAGPGLAFGIVSPFRADAVPAADVGAEVDAGAETRAETEPPAGAIRPGIFLSLARTLAPDRVGADLAAAGLAAGPVSAALAGAADPARHWAAEALLDRAAGRTARAAATARGFADAPTAATAEALLALAAEAGWGAGRDLGAAAFDAPDLRALWPALDGFAVALAERPRILAALEAPALATFLDLARHLPAVERIAAGVALAGPGIVAGRAELVLPLAELLAAGLPSEALAAALAALVEAEGRAPVPTMRSRLAAAVQRFGGAAHAGRLATLFVASDPGTLNEPRLLGRMAALDGSAFLAPLETAAGRALGPAIRAAGDLRADMRAALVANDRAALVALLEAAPDRIAALDHDTWMDGLRGWSNELAALALPSDLVVPPGGGTRRRVLAATLLRDRAALERLRAAGFLDDLSEPALAGLAVLGESGPLDAHLAARFAASESAPIRIAGDSAAAVFAHAAATARPAAAPGEGPLVSVIVSAFDPEPDLLDLSLASLRAQGGVRVEILLVDDASGPAGRAAIDAAQAADPDLRLLRLDRNAGPYIGRNIAIGRARGDYVAIQDADDWSHPDRLARQVAALQADPARQLVTARHVRIDDNGHVQLEAQFRIEGDGPMSSMFRRTVFDEVGGFAPVRSRGDIEMRERIRHYHGGRALHDLGLPMMLCRAAGTTLSQRTVRDLREHLQLWRSHIDRRPSLAAMRRDGQRFDPAGIAVPAALRAPDPAGIGVEEVSP